MASSNDQNICPPLTKNLSTKELARSLGLIRKLSSSSSKTSKIKKQPFQYLVVIDYESTCWKDKRMNYAPEIFEFPAVLLNTSTGVIESEFHHYVQPHEQHRLSDFCKQLTGITQSQVDAGIPIGTCLMLFSSWLKDLQDKKDIHFLCDVLKTSDNEQPPPEESRWCTFVTWSDWDIGICLKKECERKRHLLPPALRAWIDLRGTYKTFYSRKPNGLAGAMKDLGIQFAGRQHSGLDDARNTARLAFRMIRDGCVMNVTSSIDASVSVLHQVIQNGFKRKDSIKENKTTSKSNDKEPTKAVSHNDVNSANSVISLLSPLVSVAGCSPCGMQRCRNTVRLVAPITSLSSEMSYDGIAKHLFKEEGRKIFGPQILQQTSNIQKTSIPAQHRHSNKTFGMTSSPAEKTGSPSFSLGDSHSSHLKRNCKGSNVSLGVKNFKVPRLVGCTKLLSTQSVDVVANFQQVNEAGSSRKITQRNHHKDVKVSLDVNLQHCNMEKTSAVTPVLPHQIHGNKIVTASSAKGKENAVTPELTKSKHLGSVTPFSSSVLMMPLRYNGGGVTPPLCDCDRRSRRLTATKAGPNQDRVFYMCAVKNNRSSFGKVPVKTKKAKTGCNFFCWEP